MNQQDKEMWELLRSDIGELKDRVTVLEDVFNRGRGALWMLSKLAVLSGVITGTTLSLEKFFKWLSK